MKDEKQGNNGKIQINYDWPLRLMTIPYTLGGGGGGEAGKKVWTRGLDWCINVLGVFE